MRVQGFEDPTRGLPLVRKPPNALRGGHLNHPRFNRKEIQAKIQKLNEERKKYVAEKMKELSTKGENTLDAVMIKSLRKQATEKKFNLK